MQTSPLFSISRPPSSHIQSNDVEMLQTDVMRFFAILCLCLMAIFALVKALPMSQPADRPARSRSADPKTEARSLQLQIDALKSKLAVTQAQLQTAALAAEQSSLHARKAADDEQKAHAQLAQARQELTTVTQSLDRSRRDLKHLDVKLAGLIDDIEKKTANPVSPAIPDQE